MNEKLICDNKTAWEYRVLEWRRSYFGLPSELADKIKKDPYSYLRYHKNIFCDVAKKSIASVCGSDGQRAVALALLGADVTVFDISQMQKEYALELADNADVSIGYEVGDFCSTDIKKYGGSFDYVYCEGGILHYFYNLELFFTTICKLLKKDGKMVLCDYHPFQKMLAKEYPERNVAKTGGNYFNDELLEGHVPYEKYFTEEERKAFPKCWLRFYTMSEIINASVSSGLRIEELTEHPKRDVPKWPGEFTLIAVKN